MSAETLIHSMLARVVDDEDDKADHDFLETLLVALPLLGVEVQMEEVIGVPISQLC